MPIDNQIKKQVKFAVVMYGGGSLAIYINGVAQELLKLTQATDGSGRQINGTTIIYRKIALLLSGEIAAFEKVEELQRELKKAVAEKDTSVIAAKNTELQSELSKTTNVEFIIDVLTGSSAGGINAVFLSKAIVNGANDMLDLQKLWLEQGDFAKLLNDRKSVLDNSLNAPQEPESLLNSQRMYLELLKALDGLDNQSNTTYASSRPLDLYVTYTDFEGLPTNLALADKTVLERVHKRVFKFAQSPEKNDFTRKTNPFLAFAARCTSSFPIAFAPMRLADIDEVIDCAFPTYEDGKSDCPAWTQYFESLADENGKSVDWRNRWFVDGGCLDNKPFGYAIDKLTQRTGEGIIERKLLYIEPNPENFRHQRRKGRPPNALENVFAQASGLPSYETIREDLNRVLDRNRLIERVGRLTAEVEGDFERNSDWLAGTSSSGVDWSKADLNDVATKKGPAFIPYYRLRVSATTDEIARLVTRYFKIDAESHYFTVVRSLVRAWRERSFSEYDRDGRTFNKFLYQYDIEYRLRRLRFVLQKAEYMLRCKDEITSILVELGPEQRDLEEAATKVVETKQGVLSMKAALKEALPGSRREKDTFAESFNDGNYVAAVQQMQKELSGIYLRLRHDSEFLKANLEGVDGLPKEPSGEETPSFTDRLKKIEDELCVLEGQSSEPHEGSSNLAPAAFDRLLRHINKRKKTDCGDVGKLDGSDLLAAVYPDRERDVTRLFAAIKDAAEFLDTHIINQEGSFLRRASSKARALLGIKTHRGETSRPGPDSSPNIFDDSTREAKFVRNYLRNYYELFDSYDQMSLPLFFESPVGEAVKVDVVRISSRDAHSLINEEDPEEHRRKLAGDYLFSFGAFLDPRWRLNDIMWGRLDGAERLITTILPDELSHYRAPLIDEANEVILSEMLMAKAEDSFQGTVVEALTLASTESIERGAVDKLVQKLTAPAIRDELTKALTTALDPEKISKHVREDYEVIRQLEPRPTLETISRSTQVIGRILQKIAEDSAQAGERLSWIARLGQVFWGLVIVAAPNGILNSLFNYWIQLLYLFEVVLIIGATIFARPEIQQFGIVSIIITVLIHLSVIALQEVMLGNTFWKTLLRFLVGGTLVVFVVIGAVFFYSIFLNPEAWEKIAEFQAIIVRTEVDRWRKLILLVPFAFLLMMLALWREAQKLDLRTLGRAIIGGFVAIAGLSIFFERLIGTTPLRSPMIQLEFVEDTASLSSIIANLGGGLEAMKSALWIDTFAFIPLYLSFLLLLCVALRRRRHKWAIGAGVVAAIAAIGAGVADVVENYYSFVALTSEITDGSILLAARIKWTLVFGTLGILAMTFWRPSLKNPWNIFMALLAMLSLGGITFTFVSPVAYVPGILAFQLVIWAVIGVVFQFAKARQHFFRFY